MSTRWRLTVGFALPCLVSFSVATHAQEPESVDVLIRELLTTQRHGAEVIRVYNERQQRMLQRQRVLEDELRSIQQRLRGSNGLIADSSFEYLDGQYNRQQLVEILRRVQHSGNQQAAFRRAVIDYLCKIEKCSAKELLERFERDARTERERVRTHSVLRPTPVESVRQPTFHEVLSAIQDYIQAHPRIGDICTFKSRFPDYQRLIDGLTRSQKLTARGTAICFPSKEVWDTRPKLRGDIIRILRREGVLRQSSPSRLAATSSVREPTFDEVKSAAFGYVRFLEVDVCGLKSLVPGYHELIDTLDKSMKFEVLPGLPICFPSRAAWDSKPEFRRQLIRVLRDFRVLDS